MVDTAVSESYITTTEAADAFLAKRAGTANWSLAATTSAVKIKALQDATAIIDALPLRGERYEAAYIYNGVQKDIDNDGLTQTLEFPRWIDSVLLDYDYGTSKPIVPQKVKDACCWIALSLVDPDTDISEKTLQEAGVQSFSRGKLSVSFSPGAASKYYGLPKKAYDLLKIYIDGNAAVL